MESDERKKLLNEIALLRAEIKNTEGKPKIKPAEDYINEMRKYGDTPKDQFAHQFRLLFHPQSPPGSQMDLLPPDAILGLVKDSKTLLFLQNDNAILNRFYDM